MNLVKVHEKIVKNNTENMSTKSLRCHISISWVFRNVFTTLQDKKSLLRKESSNHKWSMLRCLCIQFDIFSLMSSYTLAEIDEFKREFSKICLLEKFVKSQNVSATRFTRVVIYRIFSITSIPLIVTTYFDTIEPNLSRIKFLQNEWKLVKSSKWLDRRQINVQI